MIQDLIDFNTIELEGVNDKINKFVASPNKNLQIFTNPLPSHSTNNVKPKKPNYMTPNDMCDKVNNHVVKFIEQPNPHPSSHIMFESREIINAPNGPLYIIVKIKGNLS